MEYGQCYEWKYVHYMGSRKITIQLERSDGGSVKKRPPHPQSLKINFNFIAGKDKGCRMMGKVYKPRPQ